jgi:RES domain-containing protein
MDLARRDRDSDPERPNTRGARWNPPRVEALYFSLKPEGAQNELEAVIARQPVPIRRPLRLFQFRAVLDRIAYLTGDTLASVGYPVETLIGEGWAGPSTIGGAASWLGLSGLLVPSARHRGSNLVVFLQNPRSPRTGGVGRRGVEAVAVEIPTT